MRDRTPVKIPFSKLNIEKVASIELKNWKLDLKIVKKDNIWKIEKPVNYKADDNSVNELLNKLKDIEVGEVITENKDKYSDYEVSPEKGTEVKVNNMDGGNSVNVIFGKMAGNYQSTFIKFADKKEVFISSGLEKNILEKDLKLWMDRVILKFKNEDVDSVVLNKKDGFEITKSSGQLILRTSAKKYDIDAQKYIDFLNQLNNLSAEDFYDDNSELGIKTTGLNSPVLRLKIKFKDGIEKEILLGKEDKESKVYLSLKDTNQIFLVSKYSFESINKKYTDLIKK